MKIKYFILFLLIVAGISLAQEGKFYEFTITNEQNLSYDIVILRPGQVPVSVYPPSSAAYRTELISFNGNILYTTYFSFTTKVIVENFDFETGEISGRTIVINVTNVTLSIPYFSTGKQINIYRQENKLLEIPVMQFAQTCGNNICDPQESYEPCQQDCPSGSADDYCDGVKDNKCDPDCLVTQDLDCREEKPEPTNTTTILIGGVIFLIIIFVLLRLKKEKTPYESLKEKWDRKQFMKTTLPRDTKPYKCY